MAAAVGTPVVALFGPTDPQVWGPRGTRVDAYTGSFMFSLFPGRDEWMFTQEVPEVNYGGEGVPVGKKNDLFLMSTENYDTGEEVPLLWSNAVLAAPMIPA